MFKFALFNCKANNLLGVAANSQPCLQSPPHWAATSTHARSRSSMIGDRGCHNWLAYGSSFTSPWSVVVAAGGRPSLSLGSGSWRLPFGWILLTSPSSCCGGLDAKHIVRITSWKHKSRAQYNYESPAVHSNIVIYLQWLLLLHHLDVWHKITLAWWRQSSIWLFDDWNSTNLHIRSI